MIRLQERIAALMECGATFDRVEREVIAPSALNSDQKHALRLFALSMADHESDSEGPTRHVEVAVYG